MQVCARRLYGDAVRNMLRPPESREFRALGWHGVNAHGSGKDGRTAVRFRRSAFCDVGSQTLA